MVNDIVSIIVPFYNARTTLRRAILSALASDIDNLEIIAVDDGSTDHGAETILLADPRLKIVAQPNGGLGAARHRGICEARGRWICLLDADDEMAPGRLRHQLAAFQLAGERAIITTGSRYLLLNGTVRIQAVRRGFPLYSRITDMFCRGHMRTDGAAMFMTAALCAEIGGFDKDLRLGEEDIWSRAIANGVEFWNVNLPLYTVHFSRTSLRFNPRYRLRDTPKLLARLEMLIANANDPTIRRRLVDFASVRMKMAIVTYFYYDLDTRLALLNLWKGRSWSRPPDKALLALALFATRHGLSSVFFYWLHFFRGIYRRVVHRLARPS